LSDEDLAHDEEDEDDEDEEEEEHVPKRAIQQTKPQQPLKHGGNKPAAVSAQASVEKKSPLSQPQSAPTKAKSPTHSPKQGVKAPVATKPHHED